MTPFFQNSQEALGYLQSRYGSADYKSWQTIRKPFYSYILYPDAGANSLTFFGTAIGAVNRQLTNIPKAGSIGQNHFLIKSIKFKYFIASENLTAFANTEATTLFSDLVWGFASAGVAELTVGARLLAQIIKPFYYAPPADGQPLVHTGGVETLTLSEATPNTLATSAIGEPHATLQSRNVNRYIFDPNIFLEAEQNFEITLKYPSGLIPVIATTVTGSNPLYVGCVLDGILFRPVQ